MNRRSPPSKPSNQLRSSVKSVSTSAVPLAMMRPIVNPKFDDFCGERSAIDVNAALVCSLIHTKMTHLLTLPMHACCDCVVIGWLRQRPREQSAIREAANTPGTIGVWTDGNGRTMRHASHAASGHSRNQRTKGKQGRLRVVSAMRVAVDVAQASTTRVVAEAAGGVCGARAALLDWNFGAA